jgi:mannose-1-phosphate guanylyltransferase
MQAMILAAGIGSRLQPHSLIRPKPLFPILNKPLLLLTIERLKKIGFDHIVVNCHHLKEQIVDVLSGLDGVIIQEEESILGTGGGLRTALESFRDEPLLVSNGDIYHTVNIEKFYEYHKKNKTRVTLAMHDFPRFNTVAVKDGKIRSFDKKRNFMQLAFTGLHMMDPSVLWSIEENTFSCIVDHYRTLLAGKEEIGCFRVDDCFWTDMGTPGDYLALHQGLLMNKIPCWQEIGDVRKPYCIDKRAKLPGHFELNDWTCIGDAHIENDSHLERVVIWDDVVVTGGSRLVDTIVSSTFN